MHVSGGDLQSNDLPGSSGCYAIRTQASAKLTCWYISLSGISHSGDGMTSVASMPEMDAKPPVVAGACVRFDQRFSLGD